MMSYKNLLKTLFVGMFALSVAACDDGGAENAGEELDETMSEASDSMEDSMEDAGNAVEDTCEDVKEGMDAEDDDC
ncbi:hypothetical protein [Salinimonas iocasae]|uniref:Uncharacterized protein n=1 Tax=Salinimonas iocasae TaxID=2572577 RepID=A0A5B7YC69_9ALTE|nr:hypothetical protein [Salinimonas iocasae]QCZ93201.1 hypothetical protein FBQ74_06750 [Salinimonas iocasae]